MDSILLSSNLKRGWYDWMCMAYKGTYTRISYNTITGDNTLRNQYNGKEITINTDMDSTIYSKGADPNKLGRRIWVHIDGNNRETTVFVLACCPCKILKEMLTVWNQKVC